MDRDHLIAQVRQKTGVRLSPSDPILSAAAINEVALEAAMEEIRKAIGVSGDQMAANLVQSEASARKAASEVIDNATEWVDARFKETAASLSAEIVGTIRVELEKVRRLTRIATRAAWISSASATISAAVAIGLVWGLI